MALSSATLSTGLRALVPTNSEATAITRIVAAFHGYFVQSQCSGVTATPAALAAAQAAMSAALVGISAPNAGATKLAAGVTAYWGAVVATTCWITAPVMLVPPIVTPGLAALPAALAATFASNVAGGLSLVAACDAVAATIHASSAGAVVPGSVPPAPPAPLPIT